MAYMLTCSDAGRVARFSSSFAISASASCRRSAYWSAVSSSSRIMKSSICRLAAMVFRCLLTHRRALSSSALVFSISARAEIECHASLSVSTFASKSVYPDVALFREDADANTPGPATDPKGLQRIPRACNGSPGPATDPKGLQRIPRAYNGSQGPTTDPKGLQRI